MEVLAMLRQLIGQVKQLLELQSSSPSSSSLLAVPPNISFHLQTPPLVHLPRFFFYFFSYLPKWVFSWFWVYFVRYEIFYFLKCAFLCKVFNFMIILRVWVYLFFVGVLRFLPGSNWVIVLFLFFMFTRCFLALS